jgi:hypothetical protein
MTDHFINLNVKGHPKKIKGGSFEPPVMREDKKKCSLPPLAKFINTKTYFQFSNANAYIMKLKVIYAI